MKYYDFLYGEIEISKEILELSQTKELARLRDVSLCAIPPRLVPCGDFISRFKHSLGVAHLAEILCTKPEFEPFKKELVLAALLHDVGSSPFSHATEHFQKEITGKTHEDFVEEILSSSEVEKIIKRWGVSLKEVISIIKGSHQPLGKLINGTIDLDNLDNSLRFGLSGGIITEKIYDPKHLVLSFDLRGSKIFILKSYAEEIEKWELCREKVYKWVYGDRNLSPGMMLFRALEFAFLAGELKKNFFYLTDSQALSYLTEKCNKATKELVREALLWKFFMKAAEYVVQSAMPRVKEVCSSWQGRKYIADRIAKELRIPKQDVCAYSGKDKGYKRIKLPFIDENGEVGKYIPRQALRWIIKVYLDPKHAEKAKKAQAVLKDIVSEKVSTNRVKDNQLW